MEIKMEIELWMQINIKRKSLPPKQMQKKCRKYKNVDADQHAEQTCTAKRLHALAAPAFAFAAIASGCTEAVKR